MPLSWARAPAASCRHVHLLHRVLVRGPSCSYPPAAQLQLRVFQTNSSSHRACASAALSLYSHNHARHSVPSKFRPPFLAVMVSKSQARPHGGHSHHSHSHDHDNSYLLSTNKNDAGVRITRIGLYVNLGMAIVKGIGGYVFNSKALTADAIHSLTDLVSDIMTLATVSLALKPPSERFPTGFGKVESIGSVGVSGMLLTGGLWMGWAAVLQLIQTFFPGFDGLAEILHLGGGDGGGGGHHHHGHSHSHTDLGPNINAAWLAGGSIIIKEWLYRATLKVANERRSSVLASNAYHHRVDSLTAFVALVMIAGSNVLNNASWMDPIGGLIISLMVIQAGLGNTKSAFLELADVNLSPETQKKIRRAATTQLTKDWPGVEVRHIQGVKAGQTYLVELELGVPANWSVEQTMTLEEALRIHIGSKVRGVKRVKIRFVPDDSGPSDFRDEFIPTGVSPRSSPEPESDDEHTHSHSHEHKEDHKHPHSR